MNQDQDRFVEGFGDIFEQQGLPRIGGRLLGLLLLSPGPLSLDELTEKLQVSKGSISANARMLEGSGIAERVKPPGERRDFYRIAEDYEQRLLRAELDRLTRLRQQLQRGLCVIPQEQDEVRDRFAKMIGRTDRSLDALLASIESADPVLDDEHAGTAGRRTG